MVSTCVLLLACVSVLTRTEASRLTKRGGELIWPLGKSYAEKSCVRGFLEPEMESGRVCRQSDSPRL